MGLISKLEDLIDGHIGIAGGISLILMAMLFSYSKNNQENPKKNSEIFIKYTATHESIKELNLNDPRGIVWYETSTEMIPLPVDHITSDTYNTYFHIPYDKARYFIIGVEYASHIKSHGKDQFERCDKIDLNKISVTNPTN